MLTVCVANKSRSFAHLWMHHSISHICHVLQLSTQAGRLRNIQFSALSLMGLCSVFLLCLRLSSSLKCRNFLANQSWDIRVFTLHKVMHHWRVLLLGKAPAATFRTSPHIIVPHRNATSLLPCCIVEQAGIVQIVWLCRFWRLFARILHLAQMLRIYHNDRRLTTGKKIGQLCVTRLHKVILLSCLSTAFSTNLQIVRISGLSLSLSPTPLPHLGRFISLLVGWRG